MDRWEDLTPKQLEGSWVAYFDTTHPRVPLWLAIIGFFLCVAVVWSIWCW